MRAFFSLGLLVAGANAAITTHDIVQPFDMGGMEALEVILGDSALWSKVMDHGCHCARLDPNSDHAKLGGITTLDQLDEICRQWNLQRACNDKMNGGTCTGFGPKTTIFYQIEIDDSADTAKCNTIDSNTGAVFGICQQHSCTIDLNFAVEVQEYLENNPGWAEMLVDDFDTCLLPDNPPQAKRCVGSPPNLSIEPYAGDPFGFGGGGGTPNSPFTPPTPINSTEAQVIENSCDQAKFDLTILLDGSGSVAADSYNQTIEFVSQLLDPLDIAHNLTRVTLAQFSSYTKVYTTFNDDIVELDEFVEEMRVDQYRGGTATNVALATMLETIETYGRAGVQQVLVVLTDGMSNQGLSMADPTTGVIYNTAFALHDSNVLVFGIGIGYYTALDELAEIATDPDDETQYNVNNYDVLRHVRLHITRTVCGGVFFDGLGGVNGTLVEFADWNIDRSIEFNEPVRHGVDPREANLGTYEVRIEDVSMHDPDFSVPAAAP